MQRQPRDQHPSGQPAAIGEPAGQRRHADSLDQDPRRGEGLAIGEHLVRPVIGGDGDDEHGRGTAPGGWQVGQQARHQQHKRRQPGDQAQTADQRDGGVQSNAAHQPGQHRRVEAEAKLAVMRKDQVAADALRIQPRRDAATARNAQRPIWEVACPFTRKREGRGTAAPGGR
ncbi:MAG: hypothetical protein B7Y81_01855 [Caulobacter sp. 32-67-35]|nr:MAG: hypothetical protein B7Y81_01855 [Caulobacter sp. 32-67-35]